MKGFRTFALSFLIMLTGLLETADTLPWGDQWTGIIMIVLGAAAAALRLYTDTPAGKGTA